MAHHKSAKKRIRSSEKKKNSNKMVESKIRTYYKKTLSVTNKEEVEKLYKEAVAILDRSVVKGKLHSNNAARKKSRLTKHLNSVSAAK